MKIIQSTSRFRALALMTAVFVVLAGCVYQTPITAKPTRKIDERLLGSWTSSDGSNKMKVMRWDDYNYSVLYNGDLFRVYHSDIGRLALVSVQILDAKTPQYSYYSWRISDNGDLHVRLVNDKIVPDDTKDSAAVQKLIKDNADNASLLGDENTMTKDK